MGLSIASYAQISIMHTTEVRSLALALMSQAMVPAIFTSSAVLMIHVDLDTLFDLPEALPPELTFLTHKVS